MTLVDDLGRQIDFIIDDLGVSATLTTYTAGSRDTYSDPSWSSSDSVITVIRERRSTPRIVVGPNGKEYTVEDDVYCKDSVSIAQRPQRSLELSLNGVTYEILGVEDQNNGLKQLAVVRMREQ